VTAWAAMPVTMPAPQKTWQAGFIPWPLTPRMKKCVGISSGWRRSVNRCNPWQRPGEIRAFFVAIFVAIPAKKFGHKRKNIFAGEKFFRRESLKYKGKTLKPLRFKGFSNGAGRGIRTPAKCSIFLRAARGLRLAVAVSWLLSGEEHSQEVCAFLFIRFRQMSVNTLHSLDVSVAGQGYRLQRRQSRVPAQGNKTVP